MRYYQSIIDISILNPGKDYVILKTSFVIFICNYDEFGRDRYIYTFENTCREEPDLKFGDESYKVVINTKGHIGEISDELKEVLKYLDDGSITGTYSQELDDAVKAVKSNEERRLEYMMLVTRDNEMRAEGRIDMLVTLVEKNIITVEQAAEQAGVSAEQFTEYYLTPESA